jgi:CubicO group peptidase (beta-lactamase class C family)
MLFLEQDSAAFASRSMLKDVPGSHFYYSSGTTNILARFYRRSFESDEDMAAHMTHFFRAIHAPSFVLERDWSGTPVMSSFGYATGRDWLRFGLLYVNGTFADRQVLDPSYVKFTAKAAPGAASGHYGAHWWLNGQIDPKHSMSGVPKSAFYALGFEGQCLVVVPSWF